MKVDRNITLIFFGLIVVLIIFSSSISLQFLYGGKPQPTSSLWEGGIFDVKKQYESELFSLPNVIGVGVGWKDGGYSIRVHTKELPSTLSVAPLILEGYAVEVVETGGFTAFSSNHYGKWRPVPGGVSVSAPLWGSGTIATTVYDSNGEAFILSNNHVLATANSDKTSWSEIGDPIMQPGILDGGREPLKGGYEVIGYLHSWVDIQVADLYDIPNSPINYVDCALAEPDDTVTFNNEILDIGLVSQTVDAQLNMQVKKSGRTTGVTYGVITEVAVTAVIHYGVYVAKFSDQIWIDPPSSDTPFSLPGDSGSLVVDSNNNAVGLLFAGDAEKGTTLINPISLVLNVLGVRLPQSYDTMSPVLLNIVPIRSFTIKTSPVDGNIYLNDIWVGNGYVKDFAEVGNYTISFGSIEGYETPNPFEIELKEETHEYSLTIVYLPRTGTIVWLFEVVEVFGFYVPRLFFLLIPPTGLVIIIYLKHKRKREV